MGCLCARRVPGRQTLLRTLLFSTVAGALCAFFVFDNSAVRKNAMSDFSESFDEQSGESTHALLDREEVVKEEEIQRRKQTFNQTWAPFVNVSVEQPKMVLLLSYQRSGSTMLSQLFNANPAVFYQFEPLDALYSARYGTREGWNVPSDITNHLDGTLRSIPPSETEAVSDHMLSLMRCQFDRLPVEVFAHPFMFTFDSQFTHSMPYINCMIKHNATKNKCKERVIVSYCGLRFGAKPEGRMNECRRLLLNHADASVTVTSNVRAAFKRHHDCFARLHARAISACLPLLQQACSTSQLRAAKVVRATMDSVGAMLRSAPNLRVIHLLRDPRGVTRSRYLLNFSVIGILPHGTKGNDSMVLEAQKYCAVAARDVRIREGLEREYPGRILQVVYEDFVLHPRRHTRDIYRFLGLDLYDADALYDAVNIEVGTEPSSNGTVPRRMVDVASKWRSKLSYDVRLRVLDACQDFYETVRYDWRL